ncbi:MAG: complement resistance protein TraT [Legionellaceae bacterium]|nr:complement resistance protein TraT [Legionellaceae bacterium]
MKAVGSVSKILSAACAATLLVSCASTQMAPQPRHAETKANLSKSIFLDPVSPEQKTIHVSVKNTSGKSMDIAPHLKMALAEHGYRVVSNPSNAHYLLQANVMSVGKMSLASSQLVLKDGYGTAVGGAGGAALGALSGLANAAGEKLAGSLVGAAADTVVGNVKHTMVTDVRISEQTRPNHYQRHCTRVVSSPERTNLSFNKAKPVLEEGLAETLAGIF